MNNEHGCIRIFVTLIFAMCLRIVPLPENLAMLNPDWVLLVLIYWSLAVPERIGIGYAWIFGILTDVLMGRLFGQYALSYSIIIYLVLIWHRQLRQFPLPQQSLFILGCLLISQTLLFWFENLKMPAQLHGTFWLPVLSGTASWFVIYYVMRLVRRF
jgi:rod shape-determining protein MreD